MKNRILNNDDYSHSKITNLVQEDKTALRDVILDFTDMIFEKRKELRELEKFVEKKKKEINRLNLGLKTAVVYGVRNFDFAESPLLLHDKEQKTIGVSVSGNNVEVSEHFLEVF